MPLGWVHLGAFSAPDPARLGTWRSASRLILARSEAVALLLSESTLDIPPRLRAFCDDFDAFGGFYQMSLNALKHE